MNSPTRSQILQLYRSLIKYGEQLKLTDKTFFLKKIKNEFRTNKSLPSQQEAHEAFEVIIYC